MKRLRANDSADSRVKVGHRQALFAEKSPVSDWAFLFQEFRLVPQGDHAWPSVIATNDGCCGFISQWLEAIQPVRVS